MKRGDRVSTDRGSVKQRKQGDPLRIICTHRGRHNTALAANGAR